MAQTALDLKQDFYDNMLLKKMQQVAFTLPSTAIGSEKVGSSALKIASKNLWSQVIPPSALFNPSDLNNYGIGLPTTIQTWKGGNINIPNLSTPQVGTGLGIKITKTPLGGGWRTGTNETIGINGNKYVHSDCPYVAFYQFVALKPAVLGTAYSYIGSTLEPSTNLLNNAIPAGYDAGGMSYDIQVMQYFDSGYPQVTLTADGYNGSRTDPLYKWFFDGTSGYLTFMTNIHTGTPAYSTPIPCMSYWRYEGQTLEDKLFAIDASMAAAGTGGGGGGGGVSVESDPSFNKYIVNPPLGVSFATQTCERTASRIYIPWDKPAQISLGAIQVYAPVITGINASWTAKISAIASPVTKSIIANNTSMIPYSGKTANSTNITGIVLTNVPQSPAVSASPTSIQFPNEQQAGGGPRNALIVYDPSFAFLDPNGTTSTNSVAVWYTNYSDLSSNINSKAFTIFVTPGYPSKPGQPSTNALSAAANTSPTSKWTLTNAPMWTDSTLGSENNAFTLSKWYFKWASSTSTIRYNVGSVALQTLDVSVYSIPTATAYTLDPDTPYTLNVQVGNSSTNSSSINSGTSGLVGLSVVSDNYSFISPGLTAKTAYPSSVKPLIFTNAAATTYTAIKVSDGGSVTGVIFATQPATNMVFTMDNFGINNVFTKGTLAGNNNLLNVTCTITGAGADAGINVNYKGFPTSGSTPATTTSSNSSVIFTPGSVADAYSSTLTNATAGFYLETGTSTITLKPTGGTNRLFGASGNQNTITSVSLVVTQYGNVAAVTNALTAYTYTAYSFYYDPYSSTPAWADVAFTPTLFSVATITQICGVKIITGEIIVKGVTIISNGGLGNYFYNNGSILTYTINGTSIGETTLTKVTSALTGGKFVYPVTFDNNSTIKFTPSTYNTSFNVQLTDVKNCLGNSPATGSAPAATIYKGIFDKTSVNNLITSIPTTASASGCRVVTGTMITAVVAGAATAYRGVTSGTDLSMNTLYVNAASIKDTNDLLFSDGYYTTPDSTTPASRTKGYLNYTSVYNNSLCNQDCGDYSSVSTTTFDGYRYATFAWKLPVSTGQYANAIIKINDLFGFDTGTAGSYPASDNGGGKKILMTYRFQNGYADGSSLNAGDNTNEPPTTIWVQGFKGTTAVPSGGAATPTNSTEANSNGLTQSSPISTFNATGSVLTSICPMKPNFAVLSLTGTSSAYMYCIIGLPMDSYIGFSSVTANWSY